MFRCLLVSSLIASQLLLISCGSDDDDDRNNETPPAVETPDDGAAQTAETSLIQVAQTRESEFSTLLSLLSATGLDETLGDLTTQFTVFAPTNDAFEALGEETLTELQNDTEALTNILLYHVISGSEVLAEQATALAGSTVDMANEQSAGLSLDGESLLINTSTVTEVDVSVENDNGVIHVIDRVLMPPTLESTRSESTIAELLSTQDQLSLLQRNLESVNLTETLGEDGPFTVFAPTNAAFEALPEETLEALAADTPALTRVLLGHVVAGQEINSVAAFAANGTEVNVATSSDDDPVTVAVAIEDGQLTISGTTVTTADIYASNGVIHIIDAVITEDSADH